MPPRREERGTGDAHGTGDAGDTYDAADPKAGQLRRILSELDDARDEARALADELTGRQLRWRPEPDDWSVGECLDHLVRTGEAYLPEIDRALARAREEDLRAKGPFSRGFLGRWLARGMEPPPGLRIPAPAPFRPSEDEEASADAALPGGPETGSDPDGPGGGGSRIPGGGGGRGPDGDESGDGAAAPLDRFLTHQDRLARRVREADGLDLEAVSVPAPVLSFLRINLMAAFAYLAAHQRRHFWQARQVIGREGFPAG